MPQGVETRDMCAVATGAEPGGLGGFQGGGHAREGDRIDRGLRGMTALAMVHSVRRLGARLVRCNRVGLIL